MDKISLLLAAIGAFVVTIGSIFALRPLALAIGLLDHPGGHKTHSGDIPIIGGVGILLGTVFSLRANPQGFGPMSHYLFSACLITITGMIDDRFKLDHKIRLLVQFTALLPMFFAVHLQVTSFGDLLGFGPILTNHWAILATAIVVLGAINAFNMLDGLDGLAASVSLSTLFLLLFSILQDNLPRHLTAAILIAALIGSIAGFLVFNAPIKGNRAIRCFMGDAGSTLIGFTLVWLLVNLSQGTHKVANPITMVWLTSIPVTDLVWTVTRRLAKGQSPFHPDRSHLHHILLDSGLSVAGVVCTMASVGLLLGMVGLSLEFCHTSERTSLLLWMLTAAGIVIGFRSFARHRRAQPANADHTGH